MNFLSGFSSSHFKVLFIPSAKGIVALKPGTNVFILELSKMTLSLLSANKVPVKEGSILQMNSDAI
jgi:hypothetical protein